MHNVEISETKCIPYLICPKEEIFLRKGEILGHLEKAIMVEEITTETMLQSEDVELTKAKL